MSGDVQPRKRKDKKRKKDELSVEEPRGTAAALGEGDVFIHSQHEHGTGGHWCAKIIFFSLLAVLLTLIGLIILENRGLTDLEANSVESRYAGVLEGWLEDAPDDDHHDEHTLELKHHDNQVRDDDKDHSQEIDHDEDDDHEELDHDNEIDQQSDEEDEDNTSDEDLGEDDEDGDEDLDDNDENQDQNDYEEQTENDDDKESEQENEYETRSHRQADENSEEQDLEDADDEDDDQEFSYEKYIERAGRRYEDVDSNDNEIEDDLQQVDDTDPEDDDHAAENSESIENDDEHNDQEKESFDSLEEDDTDDDDKSLNNFNIQLEENSLEYDQKEQEITEEEDEEEHEDTEEEDSGVEVEKLEKEISDEDALSIEKVDIAPTNEDDSVEESSNEEIPEIDAGLDEELPENDADLDEEEFLEVDDIDELLPEIEQIKVLPGKPLAEVEESTSEKPPDTLADEEEYEKRQEEIRRAQAEESHVWLKLVVGGALLAATHAVMRRATAPRDTADNDEHAVREDTPLIDRRMTLIPGEAVPPAPTKDILEATVDEPDEDEIIEEVTPVIISVAPVKQESEEYDEEIEEVEDEEIEIELKEPSVTDVKSVDKELYSDDEEAEDEEDPVIEEKIVPKQSAPITQKISQPVVEIEPEDVSDDVEIIDDEQFEEELEEEDEEDISDVDDAELLSRLEAKYGRLPEPHRPEPKHKDGGNSIEDDWPGEPNDAYWRQQLDQAENDLRQGEWSSAIQRASAPELKGSARAKWILAQALDSSAEARRDNALLSRAIAAYLELLKMNERLSDKKLLMITDRTLDRMRFRGNYLGAEPVYRLLIRRFPDDPAYRNNMTINFLMANRADLAGAVLKETLKKWPNDRVALAHHGFVLKTTSNRLEEAVEAFQRALQDDIGPATEPRFYYHLGDALLMLGRFAEAQEIHKRGAALGHFLSPAQRSLYNVDRLKSRPWWNIEQTPYAKLARALEKSWREILKEGEAARALYEKEKEGLKERGEWSQLDLFMRGKEVPGRCSRAPVTCSIVRSEPAAVGCRRGQVKFSLMQPGTHVRPHVGPTNCRLRMHLGLSNTKDTYIRVDQEIRQWQLGKTLMFDDSFEHEVWHNGTAPRLVLIVDVWHPDLTLSERHSLPAI